MKQEEINKLSFFEQSNALKKIPVQWLTYPEMHYLFAKHYGYYYELATDSVIGGYMQFKSVDGWKIWLDWNMVGPCVERYKICWKKSVLPDNYITAFTEKTRGYPMPRLFEAILNCYIRENYGDVVEIETPVSNVPDSEDKIYEYPWIRSGNAYDQQVVNRRLLEAGDND